MAALSLSLDTLNLHEYACYIVLYHGEIMSVIDKLKQLDAQREELLKSAKKEALDKANAAIKELNDLGFNYTLTTTDKPASKPRARRSGVRDEVLSAIPVRDMAGQLLGYVGVTDAKLPTKWHW